MHLLTGWLPGTPRSITETVNLEIQRSRGIIQEMIFGGASIILDADIPSVTPSVLRMGGGVTGGEVMIEDLKKLKTKKHFREEYAQRFEERARVTEDINAREILIAALNRSLSAPFSEGFFLCYKSSDIAGDVSSSSSSLSLSSKSTEERGVVTVPILGICMGKPDKRKTSDGQQSIKNVSLKQFIVDEGHEECDFEILNSIKFLIHWRTSSAVEPRPLDTRTFQPLPDDIISLLHGVNDPLPPSTTVESKWISFRELAARQAYIVGVDTMSRMPHTAVLHSTWIPLSTENMAEKISKTNTAKGKIAELLKAPNVVCGDQGGSPPMLLSLDTKNFTPLQTPLTPITPVTPHTPLTPHALGYEKNNVVIDDVTHALLLQEKEFRDLDTRTSNPSRDSESELKSAYLSLSVSIHADMVISNSNVNLNLNFSEGSDVITSPRAVQSASKKPILVNASPTLKSDSKRDLMLHSPVTPRKDTLTVGGGGGGGEGGGVAVWKGSGDGGNILPSDVVVILQEIRHDNKEPLVMRVELSAAAKIPYTRTTFHIPTDRVENKPDKLVFWVRIFSRASIHLSMSCAVPVQLGDVEEIWAGLGRNVLVREGEAAPARPHTEQLLFRIPLQISPLKNISQIISENIDTADGSGNDEILDEISDLPPPSVLMRTSEEHFVTAFLHIADREVARCVSIVLASNSIKVDSTSLPRIDGNNFLLSGTPHNFKTLIGRCFPMQSLASNLNQNPTSTSTSMSAVLPSFKWKLVVISYVPLLELASSPSSSSSSPSSSSIVRNLQQRYKGAYLPNNRMVLFRDIYSVEVCSFPIALRVSVLPLYSSAIVEGNASGSTSGRGTTSTSTSTSTSNSSLNVAEDVSIILRLYRKSDRVLVSENRGRSVIQLYQIAHEKFAISPDQNPVSAPDTPTKTKKTQKKTDLKGSGARKLPHGDEIEFILECSVDESAMIIPPEWRSRVPLTFFTDSLEIPSNTGMGTCRGKLKEALDDKNIPVISSLLPSLSPSSSTPQFQWRVDVLAGVVGEVSHDTYDIERQIEWKNAWEEKNQGRAERAISAMAYSIEKKDLKASRLLDATSDYEVSDTHQISLDKMTDLLSVALDKEDQRSVIAEREMKLSGIHEVSYLLPS